jgi:hypothetical protein
MVKIFFYTSTPKKFGTEITCTLAFSVVNSFQFHSVYSQNKLKEMLQNEMDATPIVILAATTHQELDELLPLRQQHKDFPVVLLLGDDTDETIHKAHKFHPRFLTTVHHDFNYVLSVVEQLSKTYNHVYPVEKIIPCETKHMTRMVPKGKGVR